MSINLYVCILNSRVIYCHSLNDKRNISIWLYIKLKSISDITKAVLSYKRSVVSSNNILSVR